MDRKYVVRLAYLRMGTGGPEFRYIISDDSELCDHWLRTADCLNPKLFDTLEEAYEIAFDMQTSFSPERSKVYVTPWEG